MITFIKANKIKKHFVIFLILLDTDCHNAYIKKELYTIYSCFKISHIVVTILLSLTMLVVLLVGIGDKYKKL